MTLPVFKAVAATWAFALQHWLELLKIVWLPTLVMALASFMLTPLMLEAQINITHPAGEVDPGVAGDSLRALIGNGLLLAALGLLTAALTTSGVLKLVIRGETTKLPAYLSFGRDELNVLLTMLAVGALVFGTALCTNIIAFLANRMLGASGGAVFIAIVVGSVIALFWAITRLSLASAAAIDLQRIGLKPSWETTSGRVWPLVGFWILMALPFVVVSILAGAVFTTAVAPDAGPPTSEAAQMAMMREAWARQAEAYRSGSILPAFIASTLINAVLGAVMTLAGGVAWRMLTGDRSAAPVETVSP